jgi:hypothetical protein
MLFQILEFAKRSKQAASWSYPSGTASARMFDPGASVRTLPHHVPFRPNHASLAPAPRRSGDRNPFPLLPRTEPTGSPTLPAPHARKRIATSTTSQMQNIRGENTNATKTNICCNNKLKLLQQHK